MRRLAFALLVVAGGCSGSTDPDQDVGDDDHSAERLVLEGSQITDLLGEDGVSDPIASTDGFRRLGVMWDASTEGALEIRTSLDGTTWSAWTAPTVVSVEEVARAGHVDAVDQSDDFGSLESDPLAKHYQLRVPPGAPIPTFIDLEPLADIPPRINTDLTIGLPGDVDEDDAPVDAIESVVRGTPIGNVRIYSRADWNARPRRCNGGSQTPNRATIHHTVTPTNDSMSVPARLRQIQAFHMFTRGWCDIGYNYLVSRDGRVWRGRGAETVGAHVENNNTGNVGISFVGTYTSTAPTKTQMCQAAKLLRRLHMDFPAIALTRSDVKGHRQYGGTSCPGDALYARIDDILRKAKGGCDEN